MLRAAVLSFLLLAPAADPAPPLDMGVTEETGTILGQIDVTLSGPADALARVEPGSFQVWVGGHKIEQVLADGVCSAAGRTETRAGGPEARPEMVTAPLRQTTWILYFDQPHLTLAGRARSIQLARDALPQLLGKGDRAAIVSNARSLATVQAMTSDRAALLAALDRLRKDVEQFDTFATQEEMTVQEIYQKTHMGEMEEARNIIRRAVKDERWRTQRDLVRLGMVIGRLADVDPPKALLYFADTIRRKPGDHYINMLTLMGGIAGLVDSRDMEELGQLGLPISGELDFDRLTLQAAALGIRFYTVEPQPLRDSSVRVREAQGMLQSLAAETGGRAFINGVTPKRLVSGVRADRGCLWLLSFDPEGLPRDTPLPIRVEVAIPGVEVRARGLTVIQGASQRVTNRLLAHFTEMQDQASPLRTSFVPLAWKDGKYTALLQVIAPPTSLTMTTWDLGASVVATERIAAQTSARTRVAAAGVPVALESVVELAPGPFELVAVAREVQSDRVVSSRQEGTWPDPDDALAAVVQPVVLQQGAGAFTRDGQVRKSGSVVHGPSDPLDPARPTALIALVCRSKMVKSALEVSRVLVGDSPVEFPPLVLDLGIERCGQVRDVIPERTLGPGRYHYQVVVRENGTEIGRGETSFVVPEP